MADGQTIAAAIRDAISAEWHRRIAEQIAEQIADSPDGHIAALTDAVVSAIRPHIAPDPDDDGALEDAAAEDGWEPEGGWLDGGPEDVRG